MYMGVGSRHPRFPPAGYSATCGVLPQAPPILPAFLVATREDSVVFTHHHSLYPRKFTPTSSSCLPKPSWRAGPVHEPPWYSLFPETRPFKTSLVHKGKMRMKKPKPSVGWGVPRWSARSGGCTSAVTFSPSEELPVRGRAPHVSARLGSFP